MAHEERSAGVLLFRTVPQSPGGRVFLLLDYGRYWDLPKGHVEKGEDDVTAARRELAEETGITEARLFDDFTQEVVYSFRHGKRGLVRKTVVFYLGETASKDVTISHEHVGYAFLPPEAAMERLTYANTKQVLRAALAHLNAKNTT